MEGELISSEHVAILLSLYDGEAFLDAQLASILGQTHGNWRLYWRDDASNDGSRARMRAFADGAGRGRCVEITGPSSRLGVAGSYARLLDAIPPAAYVAFSDQDDVWEPRKLEWAVEKLREITPATPALYCARQYLTNDRLEILRESARLQRSPSFPAALTQNIATGHTVMLNAATHALLRDTPPPPSVLHDWWAYILTLAAGGVVIFDDRCVSYYRQHARNTVGATGSFLRRAWGAWRRGPGVFMAIFNAIVFSLRDGSKTLSPPNRTLLDDIARAGGAVARLRILGKYRDLSRQTAAENLVFRLWYLFQRRSR